MENHKFSGTIGFNDYYEYVKLCNTMQHDTFVSCRYDNIKRILSHCTQCSYYNYDTLGPYGMIYKNIPCLLKMFPNISLLLYLSICILYDVKFK